MKASELLMAEHRVIGVMLDTLDQAIQLLEEGVSVRPGVFIEAVDFIRGFADGLHHRKEEDVLFQSMEAHGIPVEQGPIGAMLADHTLAREYTCQIQEAAVRWQSGEAAAVSSIILYTGAYIELMRTHIFKEDRILFPMAARTIPADGQAALLDGFLQAERGEAGEAERQKYLLLADTLAREISRSGGNNQG